MVEIKIPGRFNGPPLSGNGGYSCGVLAAFIDGPSRVRLHVPPPLDRELRVVEAQEYKAELKLYCQLSAGNSWFVNLCAVHR